MAKEKKRLSELEENEEESILYFEVIGILSIFIAITILSELGSVGRLLKVFFKVSFGDWYWLVTLLLFGYGVRMIYRHQFLDFKSLRLIGVFSLMISLLILSHYPVHRFVLNGYEGLMSGTWNYYMSFVGDPSTEYVLGGGIIGAIFFSILFTLLGNLGTTIIGTLLFLSGISFINNKTIMEMLSIVPKAYHGFANKSTSFKRILKYEIKTGVKRKNPFKITKLTDEDSEYNYNMQERFSNNVMSSILKILDNFDIEYLDYSYKVGYSYSEYRIFINNPLEVDLFERKVQSIINKESVLKYLSYKKLIILEIPNNFIGKLSLKSVLDHGVDKRKFPLGLDIEGNPVYFDFVTNAHLYLSGMYQDDLQMVVNEFLLSMYFVYSIDEFEILKLDKPKNYQLYTNVTDFEDLDELLEWLKDEIDHRLELFNKSNINDFQEYKEKDMKRLIVVINNFEIYFIDSSKSIEEKILYVCQIGAKVGINLIFITKRKNNLTSYMNSVIPTKLLLKVHDVNQSLEIVDYDYGLYLQRKGDCLMKFAGDIVRFQIPSVSIDEMKKILK
ncbi:FtsK/SpoIIIE domain-containing protein [Mycoplasmatota bacterium zrk1]